VASRTTTPTHMPHPTRLHFWLHNNILRSFNMPFTGSPPFQAPNAIAAMHMQYDTQTLYLNLVHRKARALSSTVNALRKATHTQTGKTPQQKTRARPSSRRRSFPPCAACASWYLLTAHSYSQSSDSFVLRMRSSRGSRRQWLW
jgi:hypothetical protein